MRLKKRMQLMIVSVITVIVLVVVVVAVNLDTTLTVTAAVTVYIITSFLLHFLLLLHVGVITRLDFPQNELIIRVHVIVEFQESKLWITGLFCFQHNLHLCTLCAYKSRRFIDYLLHFKRLRELHVERKRDTFRRFELLILRLKHRRFTDRARCC